MSDKSNQLTLQFRDSFEIFFKGAPHNLAFFVGQQCSIYCVEHETLDGIHIPAKGLLTDQVFVCQRGVKHRWVITVDSDIQTFLQQVWITVTKMVGFERREGIL